VNCGIRASTGDIVVLLNNDTEPEEDWLAQLVGGLERADGAGMATSKVLVHGRSGVLHTTGDVVDVAGWPRNRGVWETDRGQWDAEVDVFGANAAAGAYRRALFDDVGLLEEAFGSYMEDVDLAWRARLRGWRCIFVPEAIVYHHVSATGGGAAASYLVARNRCWLIARNYPTRLLIRSLPQVIGAQAAEALRALVAYRGAAARATLRGLAVGWLTWPRMLPARWRIQRSRSLPLPELERMLRGARWTRYHGRGAVSRGEEEE
jgi:GT2 family glycosyltransferase